MIHGSATHAALDVNITQSAVSRTLKEFEEIVGFRLFDRERTGLRPTREAQQLFKDVKRAHSAFADVRQSAQSIQNKEGRQLRIAALAVYVDGFASRCLSSFLTKYPGTKIRLIAASKPEIEKLVATEQVDLGITTLPVTAEQIVVRKSLKRSAVCIFPNGHPLSSKEGITLSDLLNYPLIQLVSGSPLRTLMDSKFFDLGLQTITDLEMETQRAIVNMVGTGGGIGVIDPDILSDQDRMQISSCPLTPSLDWSVALIRPSRTTPLQIAEEFLDWMSENWTEPVFTNSTVPAPHWQS
ncbi:MAG: LysR family transcriptional regulator [Sneathiella sp.]|nr:LysR family transcriptional regulator [Sneathiella sp.]